MTTDVFYIVRWYYNQGLCDKWPRIVLHCTVILQSRPVWQMTTDVLYIVHDITIKACVTNDHGCVLHCTMILQSRPVWQMTTDVFYIVRWYYNQGLCDKWPRMCFTLYGDITIKACVTNDHGCVLHCTVILQSRPVWQMTTDVFYIVQWYYNQGLCDKWPRMCFTLNSDITIKACVTNDHGCVLHCTVILQSRPVWQMTTDVFYIVQWYYNQGLCDKWPRMCFTLYDDITIKACVTNDHGCVLHCTVILQSRPVWQMTTDVFYIVRWYYNQGLCDKWPRCVLHCTVILQSRPVWQMTTDVFYIVRWYYNQGLCDKWPRMCFTLYDDITIKACVTNDHGCVLHCTVILQSRPVWQMTTDVFYIVRWYYNQGLCDKWPRMCFTLYGDITIKACVTNDHGCVLHCTVILQSRPVWQMTTDVFYIVQWYYNQGLCDKWPRMCFTLYDDITIKACVTNDHGCVLHCTVILQSRPVWQMTTDVFYIVRWYYNQGLCDKWPRMCFTLYDDITIKACVTNDHGCVLHCTVILQSRPVWQMTTDVFYIVQWYYNQGLCDKCPRMCFALYSDITIKACVTNDHGCALHCTVILQSRPVWQMTTDVFYIVRWYYNQGLCDKWPRMCFTLYGDITIKACVTNDHGCVLHCTWYCNQGLCDKWPRMCFTLYSDITIKACVTNDDGCVLHCTVILQSRPVWQMTTNVLYIVRWYYNQGLCDKWPRMCFVCRNHNQKLSSFMTYHQILNRSNTSETGTTYPCGTPDSIPIFSGFRFSRSLVFCVAFYRPLLFFFCPFSCGPGIVCPVSYGFWIPHLISSSLF